MPQFVRDHRIDFALVELLPKIIRQKNAATTRERVRKMSAPSRNNVNPLELDSHSFCDRKRSVSCLARFPLVLPKGGHTRDALEELFHERRLKPQVSMELDSSELLKRFVAAGVGVGFIARSSVDEDATANTLVAVPLSDAQVRRDLALVFRKDKALSRAALAFIDIAVKRKSVREVGAGPL